MNRNEYITALVDFTKVTLHSLIIAYYGFQSDNDQPIPLPEDIAEDAVQLARAALTFIDKSTQNFDQA